MEFSFKTQENIGFYVYALVDPRNGKVFYIGKGAGNRVFAHANDAVESETETDKLNIIREIHNAGLKVEHFIVRHGMDEPTAYEVEAALIDFLTYPNFNLEPVLSNIVAGHHQWDRGIKTVNEIEQTYAAEPLVLDPDDRILGVNLNRSYRKGKDIYEITRGWWKLSAHRIRNVNVVLGICNGIVRGVYRPERWEQASDRKDRWGFTGEEIKDSPYLNKVARGIVEFGSGNPVKYINC